MAKRKCPLFECLRKGERLSRQRRRELQQQLNATRRQLGAVFHALARQKECQIVEGYFMAGF
jgi:hypothetical protein